MKSFGTIAVALNAVLAMSLVPVLIKSSAANEIFIALARLAIAVAVLSPLLFWRGLLRGLSRRDLLHLALIGSVFAVHWLSYFVSIKWATASLAATAMATYGVQYLLLAWWVNGERLKALECLAIAVCFAGCLVMTPLAEADSRTAWGVLIGLGSAFLYSLLPLLHQRGRHMGTLQRTWGQFSFGLLIVLPLVPWANWEVLPTEWHRLLVLGLLCTVVAHGLWVKATTELPALYTGLIYYLYVPIAMITSFVFLDEEIQPQKLLGAAMILAAGSGVTWLRWRAGRVVKSSEPVDPGENLPMIDGPPLVEPRDEGAARSVQGSLS